MEKIIIASDFDGTITLEDSLFKFFETHAHTSWQKVEELWEKKVINSKVCLEKEFELVPDLSEELIDKYIENVQVDPNFKSFYKKAAENNMDFVIISDGVDFFINKICKKAEIEGIKILSNHGEFKEGKFTLSYPNQFEGCIKNSGTCKCKAVRNLKEKYDKVYYLGDGTSDYCVANKADKLFAKEKLSKYCAKEKIKCTDFKDFNELINLLF